MDAGLHLGGGGGGGGEGHSPLLAGCLPPLEVYSVALAYRVYLPRYAGTAILPPLEKNPKCSPGMTMTEGQN